LDAGLKEMKNGRVVAGSLVWFALVDDEQEERSGRREILRAPVCSLMPGKGRSNLAERKPSNQRSGVGTAAKLILDESTPQPQVTFTQVEP